MTSPVGKERKDTIRHNKPAATQTFSGGDEDLAVANGDEDEHAVLLGLVADAPGVVDLARKVLGRSREVTVSILPNGRERCTRRARGKCECEHKAKESLPMAASSPTKRVPSMRPTLRR